MTSVAIVGAGALGSVYGAVLARGGADVELLAREPHARAIRDAGHITVNDGDLQWRASLTAHWQPDWLAPADIVILLTKAQDGAAALASLPQLRDAVTLALSLQNGGGKDEILDAWCGRDRVGGAVSMVGATLTTPGSVDLTKRGRTFVGRRDPADVQLTPMLDELAALLQDGGLEAVVTDEIVAVEWNKLVHAAPAMAIATLTGRAFHDALLDPELADRYVRMLRESAAVAQAAGVEIIDLPGLFPIEAIIAADHEDAIAIVHSQGEALAARGASNVRVSMLEDAGRGRRFEIDHIHGYLIAEAERLGVDVPLSRAAYDELRALDATRD